MLLLVIVLGMIGINLNRDDKAILRDEGDRMAVLMQTAQQEAIMQGRPYVLNLAGDGYRFLRLDDSGELVAIGGGDVLGPRLLPATVAVTSVTIEGVDEESANIVFDADGALPGFLITLRAGNADWYVQGSANGKIRSDVAAAPPA